MRNMLLSSLLLCTITGCHQNSETIFGNTDYDVLEPKKKNYFRSIKSDTTLPPQFDPNLSPVLYGSINNEYSTGHPYLEWDAVPAADTYRVEMMLVIDGDVIYSSWYSFENTTNTFWLGAHTCAVEYTDMTVPMNNYPYYPFEPKYSWVGFRILAVPSSGQAGSPSNPQYFYMDKTGSYSPNDCHF